MKVDSWCVVSEEAIETLESYESELPSPVSETRAAKVTAETAIRKLRSWAESRREIGAEHTIASEWYAHRTAEQIANDDENDGPATLRSVVL